MIAALLIPVLVAGFLACHIHPVESCRLHRYEGQYLYLKSAELGFKSLAIALVLALVFHGLAWLLTLPFSWWWPTASFRPDRLWPAFVGLMSTLGGDTPSKASELAWTITLSLLTWWSAYLLRDLSAWRLRRRLRLAGYSRKSGLGRVVAGSPADLKIHVMGEILSDSPLDRLLFRLSLEKDRFAMLVMNDRKVYVGKVIDLGEPSATSGMDQEILILPLMSGYRDKDTLKVNFTTHYSEVEATIHLALRQDAIVSVTEFNFDAYARWNAIPSSSDGDERKEADQQDPCSEHGPAD